MRRRASRSFDKALAAIVALGVTAACGSDATIASAECESGEQRSCSCDIGDGVASCSSDGVWGTCQCTGVTCPTMDLVRFDGVVTDAEYNFVEQVVVAGTTKPAGLLLIDPAVGVVGEVDTMFSPTSVSVAPGGELAVTGHDGRITIVDLMALEPSEPIALPVKVGDVVAGATGYAYAWSEASSTLGDAYSVRLSDGEVTMWPSGGIDNHLRAKLHPGGGAVFAAEDTGFYLERFDVSGGLLADLTDQDLGEASPCGDVWISVEGTALYSSCGHVHALAPDGAGAHLGTLVEKVPSPWHGPKVVSVWHDELAGRAAVLHRPDDELEGDDIVPAAHRYVELFDDVGFGSVGTIDIPCVHDDPDEDRAFDARFIFGSSDGEQLYVVLVSEALGESAVVTLPAGG